MNIVHIALVFAWASVSFGITITSDVNDTTGPNSHNENIVTDAADDIDTGMVGETIVNDLSISATTGSNEPFLNSGGSGLLTGGFGFDQHTSIDRPTAAPEPVLPLLDTTLLGLSSMSEPSPLFPWEESLRNLNEYAGLGIWLLFCIVQTAMVGAVGYVLCRLFFGFSDRVQHWLYEGHHYPPWWQAQCQATLTHFDPDKPYVDALLVVLLVHFISTLITAIWMDRALHAYIAALLISLMFTLFLLGFITAGNWKAWYNLYLTWRSKEGAAELAATQRHEAGVIYNDAIYLFYFNRRTASALVSHIQTLVKNLTLSPQKGAELEQQIKKHL